MAHRTKFAKEGVNYVLSGDENRELIEILELAKLAGGISVPKLDGWIALLSGDSGDGFYEV